MVPPWPFFIDPVERKRSREGTYIYRARLAGEHMNNGDHHGQGRTNTNNLSVDDISVQLAVLKDDIASLTSTMADLTKAKSAEAANQAKSTAQDLANSGRDKALEAQQTAEDFVRTQPAAALGIAAGVGFIAGLFATRR